jgi:hypothetical protein
MIPCLIPELLSLVNRFLGKFWERSLSSSLKISFQPATWMSGSQRHKLLEISKTENPFVGIQTPSGVENSAPDLRSAAYLPPWNFVPWTTLPWNFVPWPILPWNFVPWPILPWNFVPWPLLPWNFVPWPLLPWNLVPWPIPPWNLGSLATTALEFIPWPLLPWNFVPWPLLPLELCFPTNAARKTSYRVAATTDRTYRRVGWIVGRLWGGGG